MDAGQSAAWSICRFESEDKAKKLPSVMQVDMMV